MMKVRKAALIAAIATLPAFAGWPALAQDDDDQPGAATAGVAGSEVDDDDEGVETEDIFGFTEGSDVGEAGEKEISAALLARFGKDTFVDDTSGDDDFLAIRGTLEFEYGLTDRLKASLSGSGAYFDQENVFEEGSHETSGFDGVSGELKYQLLKRGESPIGFALGGETEWSRFDEASGEQEDSLSLELKAFFDAEIVPNKLFAAFNVSYEPEWSLEDEDEEEADEGDGAEAEEESESGRESGLEISAALTGQIRDGVFLGAEARYLVAAEGLAFNDVSGQALYLGPTFYSALSKHAYFKAGWSAQVVGDTSGDDSDSGNLNLDDFERHQVLAQVGLEF